RTRPPRRIVRNLFRFRPAAKYLRAVRDRQQSDRTDPCSSAARPSLAISQELLRPCPFHCLWSPGIERPIHEPAHTVRHALPGERHEIDLAPLAGFESKRCTGRDVEAVPVRLVAIEAQVFVDFEEMGVRSHLDRAITVVVDAKTYARDGGVDL